MALLDYDKLIALLPGAACGPDLRAEPDFRDIEDAPGGFANLKAPDLKKTVKACNDFLERTKDQAPAIVALQAAVRYADFDEATTALRLIKGFAEDYWDEFHPSPAGESDRPRLGTLSKNQITVKLNYFANHPNRSATVNKRSVQIGSPPQ